MTAGVTFKTIAFGSSDYEQMVALREAVLRKPLGLTISAEELANGVKHQHYAAFDEGIVCGTTLAFSHSPKLVQFRQVAIHPDWQGKGVGAGLMAYAQVQAQANGHKEAFVHARDAAVRFYERIGYQAEGDYFPEHGIPHILMRKRF